MFLTIQTIKTPHELTYIPLIIEEYMPDLRHPPLSTRVELNLTVMAHTPLQLALLLQDNQFPCSFEYHA